MEWPNERRAESVECLPGLEIPAIIKLGKTLTSMQFHQTLARATGL